MNEATEAATTTTGQPVEYFDREGAEAYSRLSETFLRRQVAAGNLTVIRIGGRVLFRRDDLDAFLDGHRTTGPATTGRGVMPANAPTAQ
jgi:excisionase family DNA binding protein